MGEGQQEEEGSYHPGLDRAKLDGFRLVHKEAQGGGSGEEKHHPDGLRQH